ncbi:MAG: hypothetical protein ACQESD_03625 [Thermoplasmatota archaeon]
MKKMYVNWIFLLGIAIAGIIFELIAHFLLFDLFNSSNLIRLITYFGLPLLPLITFSIVSPILLIIDSGSNHFYFIGFPWIFKIKKDKLERVSIIIACYTTAI